MQIDAVTFVAQIVNFLILLYLLKRFLYGPILNAMEERRERIEQQIRDAEEREEEAGREAERHRNARQELEEQRQEFIEQARGEAEERRRQLIDHAREEVEEIEQRWHENLRDERDIFIRHMRERMGREVCSVARQALADLADRDLQAQIVRVFLQRLDRIDDEQRDQLRAAVDAPGPRITSAFELGPRQEQELTSAVRGLLGAEREARFAVSEELLCGLELNVGGRKVAWNLDSYLDALEQSIVEALERETGEGRAEEAEEEIMPLTEVEPREDAHEGEAADE